MWQAYNGFTFAFKDYTEVNLTQYVDSDQFLELTKIVDPIHYVDRLAKLPKMVLVSSDDEFMMFEWTRIWWDRMKGEKHLYIADNAEHSYATGIVGLLRSLGNFANSVYLGGTRPSFDFDLDVENGEITVRIPESQPHGKVVLRHANTLSVTKRDFRWVTNPTTDAAGNMTCEGATLMIPQIDDSHCVQPIVWVGDTLEAESPGVYKARVPRPLFGWTGAYIEVYFPSDTGLQTEYQLTTSGMVWPQKFPYPPCQAEECLGRLV
jgi:hypothetical protein